MRILLLCLLLMGCTDRERAHTMGGTYTKTLDPNRKLIHITWKESGLWILTREMKRGEEAEEYTFNEDSDGRDGTVIIKEQIK